MKNFLLTLIVQAIALFSFGQVTSTIESSYTFKPDVKFKGSTLTGWHTVGQAEWSAQNGEITGTARAGTKGGWLMLDRSYQDVAVHTLFRNTGMGETGILFRAQQTASGIKGILVSINGTDVGTYLIEFDSQGKEIKRESLRSGGGTIRVSPALRPVISGAGNPAATPVTAPSGGAAGGQRGGGGGGNAGGSRSGGGGVTLPVIRPSTAMRPGEWNQLEVFFDSNIIRPYLNDSDLRGGATDDESLLYGPIALYVSAGNEVKFKDIGYKDISERVNPKDESAPRYQVQRINDMYYSWSANAADFNKDGFIDVVAGPYIYYGPGFTKSREIFTALAFNPGKDFTNVNCQYTFDFNADGWPDVLTGPPNAAVYINPKGESRRWDKYVAVPGSIQSEVTVFQDIDGDKKPELIYMGGGTVSYAKFDPSDPTKPWTVYPVSERGYTTLHGMGAGDINGDGRADIMNAFGWWEQPATGTGGSATWVYHPEAFARYGHRASNMGGSVMAVFDVNGDKKNDVVTSLNVHGFGLAWFEQKRDATGNISFVRHMIIDDYGATNNAGGVSFSQIHGTTFADIDGDGVTDFIAGKRYWAHSDSYQDPDPYGPAVLYVFRTVRNPKAPGGAEFIPELVHNRSGAGSDVFAGDLNKDGKIDIVTSTDRGTFIFWNKTVNKPKAANK